MRELGVAPHGGGPDDDAVDERPHLGREVLDVGQAADLPAVESGHERLGGHRAAHLERAPQDGVVRGDEAGLGGGVRARGCNGAREAVGAARREGGLLGGEEGGGGSGGGGREDGVVGGCVLEARGGGGGGGKEAKAAATGWVGGGEWEEVVEAEVGVRGESGGHWSGRWSGV